MQPTNITKQVPKRLMTSIEIEFIDNDEVFLCIGFDLD